MHHDNASSTPTETPQSSTVKNHISCLERRMTLWHRGDIESLLHECRTIQQHFSNSIMFEGKVNATTRLLNSANVGTRLNLYTVITTNGDRKTVRDILKEKHPSSHPCVPSAVIDTPPPPAPHPILYEKKNGPFIHSIALKINGAAGPSGLDASAWKRLLSSFKKYSQDLCEAIASLARRLCCSYVHLSGLTASTACRLIALDKSPGVRPIGIGEVLKRIVNQAIISISKSTVQQVTGALQLCSG